MRAAHRQAPPELIMPLGDGARLHIRELAAPGSSTHSESVPAVVQQGRRGQGTSWVACGVAKTRRSSRWQHGTRGQCHAWWSECMGFGTWCCP